MMLRLLAWLTAVVLACVLAGCAVLGPAMDKGESDEAGAENATLEGQAQPHRPPEPLAPSERASQPPTAAGEQVPEAAAAPAPGETAQARPSRPAPGSHTLANPASVYCGQRGGRLEIRQDQIGNETGMCIFPDGSECEEWELFRGQCEPGDSLKLDRDPAKAACLEGGGTLEERLRYAGGRTIGSYTACVFPDGRQCEVNAWAGGFCPRAGVDVTGAHTPAAAYCELVGGTYSATRSFPEVAYEREEGVCLFGNGAECDAWALYAGQCGQHIHEAEDSQSGKLARDEGRWRYVKFAGAWFLLGYPEDQVALQVPRDDAPLTLTVSVKPLDRLPTDPSEAPLGFDRITSLSDRDALASGAYGAQIGFPVPGSAKLLTLPGPSGSPLAKSWISVAGPDPCEVHFERSAVFYRGGRRVVLTLSGDAETIVSENPEYFLKSPHACNEQPMWRESERAPGARFMDDLTEGRILGAARQWYTGFDRIMSALVFLDDEGLPPRFDPDKIQASAGASS